MPVLKKRAALSKPEKVRLSEELKRRCIEAWEKSNDREKPFSDFLRRLIHIGVNVYERQVLPIESGEAPYVESLSAWNGVERRRAERRKLGS